MVFSFLCLLMVGASHIALRATANATIQMDTPSHLLGRTLSLLFMDKALWSFGTLFIGSVASVVGTPSAVALSGLICALSAGAMIYHRGRAKEPISHPEELEKALVK